MGYLKGIDWKELMLGHGEKFILGMVLVFVTGSVATTHWGTYEKTPEEFQAKITLGESAFSASRWPADNQTVLVAHDPGAQVARLLDGTPQGLPLFQYSTRWVWPIRKRKDRLREPEFLPVLQLVADASRVLVQLQPETKEAAAFKLSRPLPDDEAAGSVAPVKPHSPDVPVPQIVVPRPDTRTDAVDEVSVAGQIPGINRDVNRDVDDDYAPGAPEGKNVAGNPGGADGPGPITGEARGMRFVALRGVIPMKLIVDRVRQALNLDTPQEAYSLVQIWDFELERQTAGPDADPWKTDWEAVDIEDTIRLLDRLEFDLDVVEEKYRNSVVVNPLPFRVTGSWDEASGLNGLIASHPAIRKILTKQEQLAEEALKLATVKAALKAEAYQQTQKAGFDLVQHNMQAMWNQMGGNQEMRSLLYDSIQEVLDEDMAGRGLDLEQIMSRLSSSIGDPGRGGGYPGTTAVRHPNGNRGMNQQPVVTIPESLLFRFFDFSVVPGNAYRYRVRLKLQNPNFDRDPAELLDVSSGEGRFRHTPWSESSTPAVVQYETHLFLDKVDKRRGVSINVYQWMTESGTYVNGLFEGLHRAEKIAARTFERKGRRGTDPMLDGGIVTDILRPAHETFQEERIDYVTPHSLIDYQRTSVITADEFPDLELTTKRIPLVFEEAITMNRFGELKHVDSDRQAQAYVGWKDLMERQKTVWRHLRHLRNTAAPVGGPGSLLPPEEVAGQSTGSRGRPQSSGKRSLGGDEFDPYGGGAYGQMPD